jgi:hypothetical protein
MIERFVSFGISNKENIRIQPFSIFDVIDLISVSKKKEKLERLQLKDHTMHTYSSTDEKTQDAIKFLKIGIKNNEATLILLDKNIDLSNFQSQMASNDIDTNKLQNEGLLIIGYSEDWYLSFNQQKNNTIGKNKVSIDNEKVYKIFFNLADQAVKNEGRRGLRIFGMMDCFFDYGLGDEIVDYDCVIPPKFNKPILSICAYSDKFIDQLSEDQIRRLVLTHKRVHI